MTSYQVTFRFRNEGSSFRSFDSLNEALYHIAQRESANIVYGPDITAIELEKIHTTYEAVAFETNPVYIELSKNFYKQRAEDDKKRVEIAASLEARKKVERLALYQELKKEFENESGQAT